MRRADPASRVRALGQGSAWNQLQPGERGKEPQFPLQVARVCNALARPLSSSRLAFAAAGLPTHPGVGAPVASGGGEGRRSEGVGLERERRKGGKGRLHTPMASSSGEGHLSSQPLSRPPTPRPCTRDGAGPGPGCHLGEISVLKLDPAPACASSPPELSPTLAVAGNSPGRVSPPYRETCGHPGKF